MKQTQLRGSRGHTLYAAPVEWRRTVRYLNEWGADPYYVDDSGRRFRRLPTGRYVLTASLTRPRRGRTHRSPR